MNIAEIVVTFILVFWLCFMISLPIGVKMPQNVEKGHASSAPERPHLKIKMLICFFMAILITVICDYFLIN